MKTGRHSLSAVRVGKAQDVLVGLRCDWVKFKERVEHDEPRRGNNFAVRY